jgi:hypothetical protein
VVLFGRLRNNINDTTVAIHLDFSKIWPRICKIESDDFERWSPSNFTLSGTCVFGERVEYMRRKHNRECSIGDTYKELEIIRTPCACTESDFECDQYHTQEKGKCVPIPGLLIPEAKCVNGVVAQPTGYVKKKISMCKGGLELHLDPNAQRCSTGTISWGVFLLITLPLTLGALYLLYLYQKGDLGRYGHIALPLDDFGRPMSFAQRFWIFASSFVSDVGSKLYHGVHFAWDWVDNRIKGNSGYVPVNTHFYDADLPTNSATALELNWDED